jgi:hydroxymethylpyrimidine pyrophosphatase-like HAD family hydrolase
VRYRVVACDYDGTLATDGQVSATTVDALERLRASGRCLVLVTGRELADLQAAFPHTGLFDWVVAENGALLFRPTTHEERTLGEPPPAAFVEGLRKRDVNPLSVGRVIVATWEPQETTVVELIKEMGLEHQVIFNKGAVMVLPPGVNKAAGLTAALGELRLSRHNTVGVGDAENDHAFLSLCECSVAVANALPALKEGADLVTERARGDGVAELVDRLIENDLADLGPGLRRHEVLLGTRDDGSDFSVRPFGETVLVAGPSSSGKSTLATGLLERLAEADYQFCLIDPEGDYELFKDAVAVGDWERVPGVEEISRVVEHPDDNVVVNLLGVATVDRPAFFQALWPRLQELRARTGRPHWLVVDEAHHLLPASGQPSSSGILGDLGGLMLVTVHPDHVAAAALAAVDTAVAVGEAPHATLAAFAGAVGEDEPPDGSVELGRDEGLAWRRGHEPFRVQIAPARTERRRHRRKYAEGELGPDRSFYFTGADGRLNLRARNLIQFLQLAEGVDDETWLHHLGRGDYSRWFADCIKDEGLAGDAAQSEGNTVASAAESRRLIRDAVQQRYSLPA